MNENGKSIAKTASQYDVKPEDTLLVHDCLELKVGKCAIKNGGSPKGHNGVRSCMVHLKSSAMPRLRVGIGRPIDKTQVVDYVLQDFSSIELPLMEATIESCTELLLMKYAPNLIGTLLSEVTRSDP